MGVPLYIIQLQLTYHRLYIIQLQLTYHRLYNTPSTDLPLVHIGGDYHRQFNISMNRKTKQLFNSLQFLVFRTLEYLFSLEKPTQPFLLPHMVMFRISIGKGGSQCVVQRERCSQLHKLHAVKYIAIENPKINK